MRTGSEKNPSLTRALAVFKDYVGLKIHFNDQMVWRRGQPLKLDEYNLLKRRDTYLFVRIAEETNDRDAIFERLVSMLKRNQSAWIGEYFEEETKQYHRERMAVVNALTYSFKMDVERVTDFMLEKKVTLKQAFLPKDGQAPLIIQEEPNIIGGIKDESLALLNKALGFCSRITNDPLWNRRAFVLSKYQHWLPLADEHLDEGISKVVLCDQRLRAQTQLN